MTLSAIKADIGGWIGRSVTHPDVLAGVEELLADTREKDTVIDYRVLHCGDNLQLVLMRWSTRPCPK